MSERRGFLMRNGFLAAGAFVILALLAMFYSTVNSAVDRASQRRAESVGNARLSSAAGTLPAGSRFVTMTASNR